MKIISSKVHGILDYAVALLLILLPFILGYQEKSFPATSVLICAGILTIIYSLFTNYELGAKNIIPLKTHFWLDLVQAILLMASPWMFGFNHLITSSFIIIGIMELVVVSLSIVQTIPAYNKNKTVMR